MNFAPMGVNVFAFKVNTLDRASFVTFGPIQQVDLFQSNKRNQGLGEDNGDLSTYFFPINVVSDMDLLDSNSSKASIV